MAAENQPAKDRLDRETKGHTDFESTPDMDPAVDPDSVDRAAGELGASDGPVDAPAAEAEGAETETGETQAGETAAGETVSEAEAAREMRAEAEATARDIVEANTTNTGALNIQTGEDIVHVHSEGIAQDLVDLARSTPPEMMEAVFEDVLDAVPHPEDVATEVNQLVAEEAGATQALTGGAAITTTVEIAAAGYGLSRMGARYLDDAAAVASARTFVPGGGWTPTNESMSAAARLSGCLARCSVGRELHSR